jgi:hypothetical protein
MRRKEIDVGVHGLEENSEAEEDAAEEDGHAGRCARDVNRSSSTSRGAGATSSRGSGGATEASNGDRRRCGSCSGS